MPMHFIVYVFPPIMDHLQIFLLAKLTNKAASLKDARMLVLEHTQSLTQKLSILTTQTKLTESLAVQGVLPRNIPILTHDFACFVSQSSVMSMLFWLLQEML